MTDLKRIRLALGLSQSQFGNLLGISRQSYQNLEYGLSYPSFETSYRFWQLTGYNPLGLFRYCDDFINSNASLVEGIHALLRSAEERGYL